MKRRTFFKLSATACAGLTLVRCGGKDRQGSAVFYEPITLMKCCDRESLTSIGKAYIERHSAQASEDRLLESLSTGITPGSNKKQHLSNLVIDDFKNGRTLVLDGWIVSVTEARQCALFSIT